MKKKSFDSGMIEFYQFDEGEKFVGYFTGKRHTLETPRGEKSYPIFADEDGTEWLLNNHSMIEKVCSELGQDVKVEIVYKGIVHIKKSGNKFANYSIFTFEDDEKETAKAENASASDVKNETEQKQDHHTPPTEKSDEDRQRETNVGKSGKGKGKGSPLREENR